MSALPHTRPTPRPGPGPLPAGWQRSQVSGSRYLWRGCIAAVWWVGSELRTHVEDVVTLDQLGELGVGLRALHAWIARGGR